MRLHILLEPRHGGSYDRILALARTATARSITVEELRFIRGIWHGPLVVKGILRGDECRMLHDLGVDAVQVSNHGGRQLDGVPATIDVLAEVVAAVDGQMEVFVDGGFRRGTDIATAPALGARAVMIGRPYLYGLTVGGQAGVTRVLELLRTELDQTMCLLGTGRVRDLDPAAVARRDRDRDRVSAHV